MSLHQAVGSPAWSASRIIPASLLLASPQLGAAVATGGFKLTLMLLAIAIEGFAVILALRNWRWPVYALLCFLPFTGIPTILLYPNTGLAALLKDVVFVIPAYLGFFASRLVNHQPVLFPAAPSVPLGLLAGLVAIQVFNPGVPNLLVGLIGVKVWLFYVPMCFLGYYLIDSKADLHRLLRLLCLGVGASCGAGRGSAFLAGPVWHGFVPYAPDGTCALRLVAEVPYRAHTYRPGLGGNILESLIRNAATPALPHPFQEILNKVGASQR